MDSWTSITTDANELMAPLHDSMPVILPREDYDLWLDAAFQAKDKLLSMLQPYPDDELTAYPVRTVVNSPPSQGEQCIERLPVP